MIFKQIVLCTAAMFCGYSLLAAPFPTDNSQWSAADLDAQRASGTKLQTEIKQALKEGKKSFDVPKGIYRFTEAEGTRPAFFNFNKVKNFTLNCNGSEFRLEKLESAISIYNCENVQIKDVNIDYEPLPFTQGKVISVDFPKNTFVFRPDPGYEALCERLLKIDLRGILFNPVDRRMKIGQSGFGLAVQKKLENGDYQVLIRGFNRLPAEVCGFVTGDLISIFGRTSRAIKIEVSAGCTLERVTLFSSPFVAFVENVGKGGHAYINCRLIKRPGTDRLMSGNADGFNSATVLVGPKLDGCEIDTIGDDFVNVHGVYYRVFEQTSPTELIVQGFGSNWVENPQLSFLENQNWKHYGIRTVVKSQAMSYVIPNQDNAEKQVWAAADNFKPGQKVQACRITLDQPLELNKNAVFSCLSAIGAKTEIRNCKFSNSLARGIRFQSREAVIENNVLDQAQGPHLSTAGQPGFWGESITSGNLKIRNNKFIAGNVDAASRFTGAIEITAPGELATAELVENIIFENNQIMRSGGAAIHVKNGKNIQIKNNIIDGINLPVNQKKEAAKEAIVVETSKEVNVSGNQVK